MVSTKTWIVTSGGRSRHPEMNGQTVPLFTPFSNGMQYPGDPAGGAEQVKDCQCLLDVNIEGTTGTPQTLEPPRSMNEMLNEAERVRDTYPAEVADSHAIPLTTEELRQGIVSDTARAWDARFAEHGTRSVETLYRAVPNQVSEQMQVGRSFTDEGFLYAHEDPRIGAAFPDGATMELIVTPDVAWLWGDSFPGERILERGLTWEITGERAAYSERGGKKVLVRVVTCVLRTS